MSELNILSALFAFFAVLIFYSLRPQQTTFASSSSRCARDSDLLPSPPPNGYNISVGYQLLGECYFADSYLSARTKFRYYSKHVDAEQISYPIHENLTMDVSVVHGNSHKLLLHISGTHGVEAYAGSANQIALLQLLAQERTRLGDAYNKIYPTVVFVHALNPYGFHYSRRVNEKNIDLNRNFLTSEQFDFVMQRNPDFAGYAKFDSVFNPTRLISSSQAIADLYALFLMGYSAVWYGLVTMKRALVSGNYYKSSGIGFGGYGLSNSAKSLIDFVSNHSSVTSADEIVVIDVHTGLGSEGVDTLLLDGSINAKKFQTVFATEYTGSVRGGLKEVLGVDRASSEKLETMSGYELTVGMVTKDFCNNWLSPHLPLDKKMCVTQEFGTVPTTTVGINTIYENYAFHHGSTKDLDVYRQRLLDSFYLQKPSWKRSIVRRGVIVCIEAIRYLQSKISE